VWKHSLADIGTYQSDGAPIGDFGINLNHSYEQEPGKTDLTQYMNLGFFTMLGGVTP
jgi:hypothetical protein